MTKQIIYSKLNSLNKHFPEIDIVSIAGIMSMEEAYRHLMRYANCAKKEKKISLTQWIQYANRVQK